MRELALTALNVVLITAAASQALAQGSPPDRPTEEQLANDNKLFSSLAIKVFKWGEPAEPAKIAGSIYFVGTKGLGVFISRRVST